MSTRRARRPEPAPKDLTPFAAARWRVVYPELLKRGAVDRDTLRGYCQVWARWREAEDKLASGGLPAQLVKSGDRIAMSPLVSIANQAAAQVRALEAHLGLVGGAADQAEDLEAPASSDRLLTRRELAHELGHHMMTVTKWEREGLPVAERGRKGRASKYRRTEVLAWLEAREARAKADGGGVDLTRERARKERAQAILAEQTYAARSKQLLPVTEVEKAWSSEVARVRAAILATYSTQAERIYQAAAVEGVLGVEDVLKAIAHDLLRELSEAPAAPPPAETAVA